jgi:hypothetical protein
MKNIGKHDLRIQAQDYSRKFKFPKFPKLLNLNPYMGYGAKLFG